MGRGLEAPPPPWDGQTGRVGTLAMQAALALEQALGLQAAPMLRAFLAQGSGLGSGPKRNYSDALSLRKWATLGGC